MTNAYHDGLQVVDVSGETDNTWFHAVYGDDMSSAIATVRASLKLKLTATSQSRWRPNSIGFPASTIGYSITLLIQIIVVLVILYFNHIYIYLHIYLIIK